MVCWLWQKRANLPTPPLPKPLTDGCYELVEVREGEEGFRQLSEEELQGTCDHVDVFPAPVVQVQAFVCNREAPGGIERRSALSCAFRPQGQDWERAYRDPPYSAASGWWPGSH